MFKGSKEEIKMSSSSRQKRVLILLKIHIENDIKINFNFFIVNTHRLDRYIFDHSQMTASIHKLAF